MHIAPWPCGRHGCRAATKVKVWCSSEQLNIVLVWYIHNLLVRVVEFGHVLDFYVNGSISHAYKLALNDDKLDILVKLGLINDKQ